MQDYSLVAPNTGFVQEPKALKQEADFTPEKRLSADQIRRDNREKEALFAREKARGIMLNCLAKSMVVPEHLELALEATIYELTDRSPRAAYLGEILALFLPEEKEIYCRNLGNILSDFGIEVKYWRGEVILSRHCKDSKLTCQVRITASGRVVMTSHFADAGALDGHRQEGEDACCSIIDNMTFLNICVHIWTQVI